MRRVAELLVALAVVVGACSKPERPSVERVTGTIGASEAGGGGASTDGGPDATAPGATTTTTATSPAPTDEASIAAAADAALNAYFDALKAEDFAAAQSVSSGGASFMAQVRELVTRFNTEREGVATLSYPERSFRVGSVDGGAVAFVGRARLDSTVSGPAGDPHSDSALFENPVVTFEDGTWHVSSYTYDGQPVEHHAANAAEVVGGVELRLRGALSFGSNTGLVVDLVTDADHAIRVDEVTLEHSDGASIPSTFGALISHKPSALYFLFERGAGRPVAWTATVTIDEGTASEVTEKISLRF